MDAIKGFNVASRNLKINLKNMTPREIGILNNTSEFLKKESKKFHISISKKQHGQKEGFKIEVTKKDMDFFERVTNSLGSKGKKNARTNVKWWSDEKFIEHFKSQLQRAEDIYLKKTGAEPVRGKSVISGFDTKEIRRTINGQMVKQITVDDYSNIIKIYNSPTKTEEYRKYFPNGKIFNEKITVNGKVIKDFEYRNDGSLALTKTYNPATKTEEYRKYFSNGKICHEKTTIDGKAIKDFEYHNDGSLAETTTYDPATKTEEYRKYFSNGNVFHEKTTVGDTVVKDLWLDENGKPSSPPMEDWERRLIISLWEKRMKNSEHQFDIYSDG